MSIKVSLPTSYSTITLWDKCNLSFKYKSVGQGQSPAPKIFIDGRERHELLQRYGEFI